eukprot:10613094-Alexandrium_andersonii.AAC.1
MPPRAGAPAYAGPLPWVPAVGAEGRASRAWNRASTAFAKSSARVTCTRRASRSPENSACQEDWRSSAALRA